MRASARNGTGSGCPFHALRFVHIKSVSFIELLFLTITLLCLFVINSRGSQRGNKGPLGFLENIVLKNKAGYYQSFLLLLLLLRSYSYCAV